MEILIFPVLLTVIAIILLRGPILKSIVAGAALLLVVGYAAHNWETARWLVGVVAAGIVGFVLLAWLDVRELRSRRMARIAASAQPKTPARTESEQLANALRLGLERKDFSTLDRLLKDTRFAARFDQDWEQFEPGLYRRRPESFFTYQPVAYVAISPGGARASFDALRDARRYLKTGELKPEPREPKSEDDPFVGAVKDRPVKRAILDLQELIEQEGMVERFQEASERRETNLWRHPAGIYLAVSPAGSPRVFSAISDARRFRGPL